MVSLGMEEGDAEPGKAGAEQPPGAGGPWRRRQVLVLQLLHGTEEPLKRMKGLVQGWMGSQRWEGCFRGVCGYGWKSS